MSTDNGSTQQRARRKRRETNGMRKLSFDDVDAIVARLQRGETPAVIALDYPVSRAMISMIASGKKWATITRRFQVALPDGGTMAFSWTCHELHPLQKGMSLRYVASS
jgi:hypothetical protein